LTFASVHGLRSEYEGALDVDDRLVTDLIVACRTVAEKVQQLRRI
jgi:hypothetical protein